MSRDALVRRVDEDRWLASRFAPAPVRACLVALYALNYEIARTAETVTQEAIGDIRLAWWREAVDEIYAGRAPRAHPVLEAYAEAVRDAGLPRGPLDALIAARGADLDAAPFESWDDLDAYLDATAGGLITLAIAACGGAAHAEFARAAGRAWGYAGLLRAEPFWAARGRSFYPRAHRDAGRPAMLERAEHGYESARSLSAALPSALFPAYGYLALLPRYLRALRNEKPAPPLLLRQATLIASAATGKI